MMYKFAIAAQNKSKKRIATHFLENGYPILIVGFIVVLFSVLFKLDYSQLEIIYLRNELFYLWLTGIVCCVLSVFCDKRFNTNTSSVQTAEPIRYINKWVPLYIITSELLQAISTICAISMIFVFMFTIYTHFTI